MTKYLLTFKPLKNFFFGNSKTFSEDYFAVSEYFAQPTQLLGAIRLFIAEQHKLIKVFRNGKWSDNPEDLKKLIGNAGAKDFDTNENLGMIQNISQMFLVNESLSDAYFPTPFNIKVEFEDSSTQIMDESGKIVQVNYPQKSNVSFYNLTSIDNNYFLDNYDVKNTSSQLLGNNMFWNNYINNKQAKYINSFFKYDDIFIAHSQVGIELENKRVVNEKFYSKTDYNLKKGFLFGALIELEEKIIEDGIIQIGAEASLFELKVIPLNETKLKEHTIVANLFNEVNNKNAKLIALSEVLANSSDFEADFYIVPFYKDFAMIDSQRKKFSKTKQMRLIPAGSVFYNAQNLPKLQGAYKKMGFNKFISIKEEE